MRKYVVEVTPVPKKHEAVMIGGKKFIVRTDKCQHESIELETARTSAGKTVRILDAHTRQEIVTKVGGVTYYKQNQVLAYHAGTFHSNVPIRATPSPDWTFPLEPEESANEFIQDLFREACMGRFEAFSEKIKGVIKRNTAQASTKRSDQAPTTTEQQTLDPLSAARQRGTQYALNEWQKPENLSLQMAAIYAGVSDNTVNTRRLRQQIYALVAPNRSRGFRYPQWQFDVDPDRLRTYP